MLWLNLYRQITLALLFLLPDYINKDLFLCMFNTEQYSMKGRECFPCARPISILLEHTIWKRFAIKVTIRSNPIVDIVISSNFCRTENPWTFQWRLCERTLQCCWWKITFYSKDNILKVFTNEHVSCVQVQEFGRMFLILFPIHYIW